tara:strand:+ start:103 stop:420 length:318 start_codon:yes stop_codon:yes gene_type:complete
MERNYSFKIIEYNVEVDDSKTLYNISYTNEQGHVRKVDKIQGSWRKLIVVPNKKIPIHLSTISYERMNGIMEANIHIDGELISEDNSNIGIVNILSIEKPSYERS